MNALKKWLTPLGLLILLAALVSFHLKGESQILFLLQESFPMAQITRGQGDVECYLIKEKEAASKRIYPSRPTGWGGPMVVAPVVDKNLALEEVVILKHRETPAFFDYVKTSGFLGQFQSKTHMDPLALQTDIDAVTGATITSRAITRGVREAMDQAAWELLGVKPTEKRAEIHFGFREALLLSLFGLTFVAVKKKWRKTRLPVLAASFLFLGLMTKSPVSVSNIAALLMGHGPTLSEHLFWWILVPGSLVFVALLGKNAWCGWLCPFGAIQEGILRTGGLKLSVPKPLQKPLKSAPKIVALAALLAAFISGNASRASVEPFATLFGLKGAPWQWYLVSFAIAGSFLIPRFWCRYFCPAGVCFTCAAKTKHQCRKLTKKGITSLSA
ncbi:MAG: 4Fe-4S binding protein [Desulfobacterales bacterium]|nr:4Fe-4S binding protein [Desulfobacterales bacterium]